MPDEGRPQVVYLDQNKWVELGRAHHGRQGGGQYKATLDALAAAPQEDIVFPLGLVHYIETLNTKDVGGRRRRLAEAMALLSRFHTLANPFKLRDYEIRLAFQMLGYGVSHIFGDEADAARSSRQRRLFGPDWTQFEIEILAGTFPIPDSAREGWRREAAKHLENTLALDKSLAEFAEQGYAREHRRERRKLFRLMEDKQLIEMAAPLVADSWDPMRTPRRPPAGWEDNLHEEVPIIYTSHELLLAIYDNPQIRRNREQLR